MTIISHDKLRGVKFTFNDDDATLLIWANGQTCELDDSDVDSLLRLFEHSAQPLDDLSEYFEDSEGFVSRFAYRIAEMFAANARELARLVYA